MAGKACHAFGSTTRFGLTQALGLMGKHIGSFIVLLLACPPTLAAGPEFVPIQELRARSNQLLGSSVVTHGCLVSTIHGGYIHPCESEDWRDITSAYVQGNIVIEALRKIRPRRVWTHYEVEGTFTGTLVHSSVDENSQEVYFKVTSFDSITLYEP